MSICPHCQAENEPGATTCRACGKPLAATTSTEGLPLWLQALNPEGRAEDAQDTVVAQAHTPAAVDTTPATPETEEEHADPEAAEQPATEARETDMVVAQAETNTTPTAAPAPVEERETPVFAKPTAQPSGTDTVIATQPTAARSTSPASAAPASPAANETASLINEDDLPAWLRAFSEPEKNTVAAASDDQSWMLGNSMTPSEEQEASDLAQSWQAPPRATAVERTSAAAIFAAPAVKPASVTRPERLIAPAAPPLAATEPVEAPTPAPTAKGTAASATPVRLGAGRPIPATTPRVNSSVQRTAIIAFLAALIIFLVVLVIFVVAPALRG